jgi:hypothetical protein
VPVSLILPVSALSVKHAPAALDPVPELSLIPTAIAPPESSLTIALSRLELSLINITFLASPVVYTPSFLFVKPEFSNVEVTSCKIELSLAFKLSIVELPMDDLVSTLEKTDSLAVRSVHLGLPDVDNFSVLEKFGIIEGGLNAKHHRRTILDSEQLLKSELDCSQFATDEGSFIVEVIKVELRLLQHLLLRGLVNFELAAHAADEKIERFIHFLNGLEPACLDLFE